MATADRCRLSATWAASCRWSHERSRGTTDPSRCRERGGVSGPAPSLVAADHHLGRPVGRAGPAVLLPGRSPHPARHHDRHGARCAVRLQRAVRDRPAGAAGGVDLPRLRHRDVARLEGWPGADRWPRRCEATSGSSWVGSSPPPSSSSSWPASGPTSSCSQGAQEVARDRVRSGHRRRRPSCRSR